MRRAALGLVAGVTLCLQACGPRDLGLHGFMDTGLSGSTALWPDSTLVFQGYESRGSITRKRAGGFHAVMPAIRVRETAGVAGRVRDCTVPVVSYIDAQDKPQITDAFNVVCPQKGMEYAANGDFLVTVEFDFEAEPKASDWFVKATWHLTHGGMFSLDKLFIGGWASDIDVCPGA